MQEFEKLGVFYLGRAYDPGAGRATEDLLLYDSRDLLTHAVCVGMTGSGKTGLCLALLEEAAIDGVPAIAIDPKGDLGNLLLTFPGLDAEEFRPWIDEEDAARQGVTPDALATKVAGEWKRGLAEWGQDGSRVARLREAADAVIYTPGSGAGLPLSVLRSLAAPSAAAAADGELLRDRVLATVSGLLALVGIEADPLRGREHVLLSNLLDRAWRAGRDLDLGELVRGVQSPPFDRVGVVDLESFYPARERSALAMSLNNLLASPGFEAWLTGEPLDVERLLWTRDGKPRLSVLSIAHLSDAERMFFVTLLLGEVIAWMRSKPGTTSLRALLYMDEVFGFLPPVANPPSKVPMLTLLKQARAFGLGVVLASQNPVDLDYKGLSNAGTWFLGRLQTERDKERVLDGLEGARAASGRTLDREATGKLLAGLGRRVFLLSDVHADAPVTFQTRWTLSYLRGPLTRAQVQILMAPRKQTPPAASPGGAQGTATGAAPRSGPAPSSTRPVLPAEVPERFLSTPGTAGVAYRPCLYGECRLHYVDAKTGVDAWETVGLLARLADVVPPDPWDAADPVDPATLDLVAEPEAGSSFAILPADASRPRSYGAWGKKLTETLYRTRSLDLWQCGSPKLVSRPGETEGEFRVRAAQAARERRDADVAALRQRYAARIAALEERARRADDRTAREQAQYDRQKVQTAISLGATVLGALLGRRALSTATIGRAATAARSAGRAAGEREDVARAEEGAGDARQRLQDLQRDLDVEIAALDAVGPDRLTLERITLRPRKSDLAVERVALVWVPLT